MKDWRNYKMIWRKETKTIPHFIVHYKKVKFINKNKEAQYPHIWRNNNNTIQINNILHIKNTTPNNKILHSITSKTGKISFILHAKLKCLNLKINIKNPDLSPDPFLMFLTDQYLINQYQNPIDPNLLLKNKKKFHILDWINNLPNYSKILISQWIFKDSIKKQKNMNALIVKDKIFIRTY